MSLSTLPGPKGWPIVGMAPAFQRDAYAYAAEVASHGDLVRVPFPGTELVYVLHPDLVEQVLVRQAKTMVKGRFMSRLEIVLGEGLLLAEGDDWRTQRRRMAPAFTRDAVREMTARMGPVAATAVAGWQDGETRSIDEDMIALTLEVVLQALFGTTTGDDVETVRVAFSEISDWFASIVDALAPIPMWVPTPGNIRFKRGRASLDTVVGRILEERRQRAEPGTDLLGRLIAATAAEGAPLDEARLADEVRTVMLAGHETTAIALTASLYELARHPEHQAWAAEEVLGLDGEPDADTPLPRLDAVLDETMRLHPPAPAFAREPTEDIELGGHTIPTGTTLMLAPFILHRSERYFDEPLVWNPQRWTPEMRSALPRFAFYPFGGGPRVCIGAAMARVEVRLALVSILRRFRIEAPPEARLRLVPSVTLRPAEPVRLRVVER